MARAALRLGREEWSVGKLGKRIWWHKSNENYRPGDDWNATGSILRYGRFWLHFAEALVFRWEWCLFKYRACHIKMHVNGDENEITWALSFPPVSLYFTIGGRWMDPVMRLLRVDFDSCKGMPDGSYNM